MVLACDRRKGGHFAGKLLLSAVLAGLALRLVLSSVPPEFAPAPVPLSPEHAASAPPASARVTDGRASVKSSEEKCNIFIGEWIPNPDRPAYTNQTCRFIEPPQDCMTNGRPDTDYLHWRWKPDDCDLLPFDAKTFLSTMRDKSWALIGDSLLRNHAQSLICLLSQVEEPVELYHDEAYKSRRWLFGLHNMSLSLIWSPYLVKAEIFEDENGVVRGDHELHLDTPDGNWTSKFDLFDYVVMSAGQWFAKPAIYFQNGTAIGCHSCKASNLTEVNFESSFRMALGAAFEFITEAVHHAVVFYRTWTPSHFENGEWFSGGTCNRTAPARRGEMIAGKEWERVMYRIELEQFRAAEARDSPRRRLKLMDTFEMMLMRPDGHSGPYRNYHPFDRKEGAVVQNDCLHWCLPGPIDVWNELLMQMVV